MEPEYIKALTEICLTSKYVILSADYIIYKYITIKYIEKGINSGIFFDVNYVFLSEIQRHISETFRSYVMADGLMADFMQLRMVRTVLMIKKMMK